MKSRNLIFYLITTLIIIGVSCEKDDLHTPELLLEDPVLKDDCDYIIVIGDTQVYTNDIKYYPYYEATMNWIWSQCKYGKNIRCVLHTGDITENNSPHQYKLFYNVTAPTVALIPYVACIGNHDYTWESINIISDRYSTHFSSYTKFDRNKLDIVNSFEDGRMENIIVKNTINGERVDIISLEFGPRNEVIEWVNTHVQLHPDCKYILMTHEYLSAKGERISTDAYSLRQLRNTTTNTPEQLWEQLVYENNNIVSVLCGHNGFSTHLFTKNSHNRDVLQVLFNLQYQNNGGDGWIQIWEFPLNSDYANVYVYNTITREYHSNIQGFQFNYKFNIDASNYISGWNGS